MTIYEEFRQQISGAVVCLPILFRDDLSVDYAGIEEYTAWVLEKGLTQTCLTYGYSLVGFVTPEELMEITRVITGVVGDRGIFISCTLGNSAMETVKAVNEMQEVGVDAAFVMPNIHYHGGGYPAFLHYVAGQTELPLLFTNDPDFHIPLAPNVSVDDCESLLEHENIVGLKDDTRIAGFRMELIRRFGDRLCIIGPGTRRDYLFYHYYPQQANLDGYFSPTETMRFLGLLDEQKLSEALKLVERQEAAFREIHSIPDLEGLAANWVCLHTMGFGESWRVRPPIVSATEQQAREVSAVVSRYPDIFEHA